MATCCLPFEGRLQIAIECSIPQPEWKWLIKYAAGILLKMKRERTKQDKMKRAVAFLSAADIEHWKTRQISAKKADA